MNVVIRDLNTMNVGVQDAEDFRARMSGKEQRYLSMKEAVEVYIEKYIPAEMMFSIDGKTAHEFCQQVSA